MKFEHTEVWGFPHFISWVKTLPYAQELITGGE